MNAATASKRCPHSALRVFTKLAVGYGWATRVPDPLPDESRTVRVNAIRVDITVTMRINITFVFFVSFYCHPNANDSAAATAATVDDDDDGDGDSSPNPVDLLSFPFLQDFLRLLLYPTMTVA
ncbi:hypothetical protein KPH14_003936 [Odynerus spinipes]|uniref:Uncharacterized protein n=1 Tax=Odynerus spinipes TaxID=1348599 RepID=A0AAD9VUV8_9HYME|nr:hypothetical protein KPH14_003936 [Odynerus spinipes]